jgi:GTP-binding protein
MNIKSATFVKGVTNIDPSLADGVPQIAFIGRSNVGKSSVINTLANQKGLAKTSSFPGRTQQINLFLINKSFYLVDLPGYGFAQVSKEKRSQIEELINWYFFESNCDLKKVILIIDAKIGPTKDDMEMLFSLEAHEKNIIIVANKVDKIKKPDYDKQLGKIRAMVGIHKVIPYSAEKKIGVGELADEMLK